MEFVYQYSASGKDYSKILSHYQTRKLTKEELTNGMFGERVITFNSLEELMNFEENVGEIVVCRAMRRDGTLYKAIVIYDDYLE